MSKQLVLIEMEEKTGKTLAEDWIRVKKYLETLETQYQSQLSSLGNKAPETQETAQTLFALCCHEGMKLLEKGDQSISLGLLKRAETLAVKEEMQIEVWKSLACYYGGAGKHFRALIYLDKAHDLERKQPSSPSIAKTHLNYCAILSQLNRHDKALTHALKAVMIMQDELLTSSLRNQSLVESNTEELAVAYYNLAVEFEHQKDYASAMKWYNKGKLFAEEYLPEGNQCRVNMGKREMLQQDDVVAKTRRRRERRDMGEKTDSVAYLTELKAKIQTVKKGDTGRRKQLSTYSGSEDSHRLKGVTSQSPTSRDKVDLPKRASLDDSSAQPFTTSLPQSSHPQKAAEIASKVIKEDSKEAE